MAKVIVYSTPACVYCKMAKEFLSSNNISFTDYDVSTDEKARDDMIQKTGQLGVPVIDIDGSIMVGFDKAKIKELLKI